jgi:hypothetical protein
MSSQNQRGRSPTKEDRRAQRSSTSPSSRERGISPSKKDGSEKRNAASPSSKDRSKSPGKGGRSKSPGKFGEKDFERKKVGAEEARLRQQAIAKVRGLKVDASQWSRQELMDKLNSFAHFAADPKTGVSTLSVDGKRILNEEISVLLEIMRRVTEIQAISFVGCGLTDEGFSQLLKGMTGLRHLKELRLRSNLLTGLTAQSIVKSFAKLSRKLVVLDLQLNSLLFDDGKLLYYAFAHHLQELNGMPLGVFKAEENLLEVLNLENKGLRLAELGVVCAMLPSLKRVRTVVLARNLVGSEGLRQLVGALQTRDCRHIASLDLSHNPFTDEGGGGGGGSDWTGFKALVAFAKNSTQLHRVLLEGPALPPGIRQEEQEQLALSLMANRSVAGHTDGSYFNKFTRALIERTAAAHCGGRGDGSALADWRGKMDELDLAFIRRNSIPHRTVQVVHANRSGTGKDEIIISREALPNRNIIEF